MIALELVGSILLAICGIPAAWQAWKTGTASFPWAFLWCWLMGEVLLFVWALVGGHVILAGLNYGPNIVAILVIITYNNRQEIRDRRRDNG